MAGSKSRRPVVIIVRDGWGHNPHPEMNDCNAIHLADTPCNDSLLGEYPNVTIRTSGEDVGLPDGVMGNSEVGHQNIGAGRIVDQELMRITRRIRDGSFFKNDVLEASVEHVKRTGGKVHLLGLVSDGGVHSHIDHLFALFDFYHNAGMGDGSVVLHAIMDGRDTSPTGGLEYLRKTEEKIADIPSACIGSVIGRFYAMDRDYRWERVQTAYDLLTKGTGRTAASATESVQRYYDNPSDANRPGDEFVEATRIGNVEGDRIKSGDAVVFFNYRGDRPRELTKAFVYDDAAWAKINGGGFDRGKKLDDLFFSTLANYEEGLPVEVIIPKAEKMKNILGDYLAANSKAQFRCAESEKHPHVTYFFNDYRLDNYPRELQIDIPSPKYVSTYNQKPEMSCNEVTNAVLKAIGSDLFDFILVNYANGDMVGHTGVLEAVVKAVEAVDKGVERLVEAVLAKGGALLVTADHGNAEQMFDPETKGPHTRHTTYEVDLIVVDEASKGRTLRTGGRLADIAPTVLELMDLPKPEEMTGESLLKV